MKVECSAFVLAQQESFLLQIRFLKQESSQKLVLIRMNLDISVVVSIAVIAVHSHPLDS